MGRNKYHETRRTQEYAIDEKLQVLKDFCVVDRTNEEECRKMLLNAVNKEPNTHFDIVLDRVAKRMISEKIYGGIG